MRTAKSQSGVVLIEALLGILIFSIGILALIGMQATAIRNTADARYRSEASFLATEVIGRMWLDIANIGDFDKDSGAFAPRDDWETKVLKTLPGVDIAGATRPTIEVDGVTGEVTVTVLWQQPGETSDPAPADGQPHQRSQHAMSPLGRARQSGMSLVELMVGMAIGLIGITIITHLYLVNEKYKRSTTGSGTAQVNGAIALYTLERDIRMAGFGLNHSGALGCSCDKVANPNCSAVQYFYNGVYSSPPGPAGGALPPLDFVPVEIIETPNLPDSITLLYGNDPERMLPGKLTESMPQPSSEFKVDGTAGYTINDMVLVTNGCELHDDAGDAGADRRRAPAAQPGPSCGIRPAAAAPCRHSRPARISSTWASRSGAPTPSTGGQQEQAAVHGGAHHRRRRRRRRGADHRRHRRPAGAIRQGHGRQRRGRDLEHRDADERRAVAAGARRARRSAGAQRELRASGSCRRRLRSDDHRSRNGETPGALQDFPTLLVAGALPSCYKYRVFETIIPLRNMIWRPA